MVLALTAAGALAAEESRLRLPALYSDHMVLQANQPAVVWGWSAPGQAVAVSVAGQTRRGEADWTGHWQVTLEPLPPGAVTDLEVVAASGERLVVQDVLAGEVWLGSGQSNMAFSVAEAAGGAQVLTGPRSARIRLLRVAERAALEPEADAIAAWASATDDGALASFSAVAYYFAERLERELDVPVGVIQAAYGGAVGEAFLSPQALGDPRWVPLLDTWERFIREYPASPEERARVAAERRAALLAAGKVPPPWELEPKPPTHFHRPGCLFNGMIHPLIPVPLAGFLWYQGEANGWRGHQYRRLLPALIADWRAQWGRPTLPFLFVQLPGFDADWLEAGTWPELREAQLLTWQGVPHTAMVTSIDVGDPQELHAPRKREVGERLALAALATAYGRPVEFSGPVFRGLQVEGTRLRLSFDHAADGLVCRGERLTGFAVAGADRRFVPAQAALDGQTVVAWAEAVPAPVAVRYGWANAPTVNLFSAGGLPASPFRSDTWPGITDGRQEPEAY